ncbi:MAG TPA: hypothetical protein VMV55_06715, partial [Methanoregula sp.]|nr:hypothetical protein [Methanoregula sp.]
VIFFFSWVPLYTKSPFVDEWSDFFINQNNFAELDLVRCDKKRWKQNSSYGKSANAIRKAREEEGVAWAVLGGTAHR